MRILVFITIVGLVTFAPNLHGAKRSIVDCHTSFGSSALSQVANQTDLDHIQAWLDQYLGTTGSPGSYHSGGRSTAQISKKWWGTQAIVTPDANQRVNEFQTPRKSVAPNMPPFVVEFQTAVLKKTIRMIQAQGGAVGKNARMFFLRYFIGRNEKNDSVGFHSDGRYREDVPFWQALLLIGQDPSIQGGRFLRQSVNANNLEVVATHLSPGQNFVFEGHRSTHRPELMSRGPEGPDLAFRDILSIIFDPVEFPD